MDITVFSAAGCGKCVATKFQLKGLGIPFTEVRIDQNPVVEASVKAAGITGQLPVVMAFRSEDDEVPDFWNDFHPDWVKALTDTERAIPTA